jgi:hypothetical protein
VGDPTPIGNLYSEGFLLCCIPAHGKPLVDAVVNLVKGKTPKELKELKIVC